MIKGHYKAIFTIWNGTLLSSGCGSYGTYGVYVAITGSIHVYVATVLKLFTIFAVPSSKRHIGLYIRKIAT